MQSRSNTDDVKRVDSCYNVGNVENVENDIENVKSINNFDNICDHAEDDVVTTTTGTKWKYLVLGGGGIWGLALSGAIEALLKTRRRCSSLEVNDFEGYVGTSVGALIALTLCLGIESARLRTIWETRVDWSRLRVGMDAHIVMERYGFDNRSCLEYLVELCLSEAGVTNDITLGDMFRLTSRHFCCVVTDLTNSKVVYFDHRTKPELSVRDAVVASMCVPILFEPLCIDGACCVDGGLIENVAMNFFNVEESLVVRVKRASARKIENWRDYVSAVIRCGQIAKENRDYDGLSESVRSDSVYTVWIPDHAPDALEINKLNPEVVRFLSVLGFLQLLPKEVQKSICSFVANMTHLSLVLHGSMQDVY